MGPTLSGLGTDRCDMGPCIIMLKHEVMAVDEWHDNGPQDLITVSLCIQIAFNKMQLCPYLMPNHILIPQPPWGTVFTTLISANCSPTRLHTHGLRLWGRLDILPYSLKWRWRRIMVKKLTLHSLAPALVVIAPVSMPIANSLKTRHLWHCVVCQNDTFRVAFCSPQRKVHLCNDHTV